MKLFFLFMLLCIVGSLRASPAIADEPPSWREFEVSSQNGRYTAKVTGQLFEVEYKITVFEKEDPQKEIWSCVYEHDGYAGGILSNDGSTFVYVSTWYAHDYPVVWIYRNGRKVGTLEGEDFHVDPSKQVQTVSHQLWLNGPPAYRFITTASLPLALEIVTIDGKIHRIDVGSARFMKGTHE